MNKTFLLNTKTGKKLYKTVKDLPVIDYHNHLSVYDIAKDKKFDNIYDLWIKPDPYKHRAMRMCGVHEKYITGSANNREKFKKWCETVPKLLGNPLYIWSVTELATIFDIHEVPSGDNADKLYNKCNEYLKNNAVTANSILNKFGVEYICPCMSLIDDISPFDNIEKIVPSLRGDDIVNITCEFIETLENITGISITDLSSFETAISTRLEQFMKWGWCFSDHALDNGFQFYENDGKNKDRFSLVLKNKELTSDDKARLSSYMLEFLANKYAKYGFVMQLHIGAQRYTSSILREKAGAAGGFAGIGNSVDIQALTRFLDCVDKKAERLPKILLFSLNPADNALIATLSGSYSKDGVSGLITQGPAWWWCDHIFGIKEVLESSSAFGVLSNFVGMTTDSRSLMSFVRHDYFRRILCDYLGEKYEQNELGCELDELKKIAYKMCYGNAKKMSGGI